MSTPEIRTPEVIQAELEATRAQMSATVDQLVHTLQPSTQIARAKDNLREKASTFTDTARATYADAREGDPEAMKTIGKAVLGVVAVVGLCLLRKAVRRHNSAK